jgi:cbb3-type cytochrome oxidase maturation protein
LRDLDAAEFRDGGAVRDRGDALDGAAILGTRQRTPGVRNHPPGACIPNSREFAGGSRSGGHGAMSVLVLLIFASLAIAATFLIAFIWAVRSGQYEDTFTPSMRVLMEDPPARREADIFPTEQDKQKS